MVPIGEIFLGIFTGLVMSIYPAIAIILISLLVRIFTDSDLPVGLAMIFGLGIAGLTVDLSAMMAEMLSVHVAISWLMVLIVSVWARNFGDKTAQRMMARKLPLETSLLRYLMPSIVRRHTHISIQLPPAHLIENIPGKPPVGKELKEELSKSVFTLPADLPKEELEERIRRRLLTDWGVGDARVKMGEVGEITQLAICGKEAGISVAIPSGKVVMAVVVQAVPYGLGYGDLVDVVIDNEVAVRKAEVQGVATTGQPTVTLLVSESDAHVLFKIGALEKRVSLVALPKSDSTEKTQD